MMNKLHFTRKALQFPDLVSEEKGFSPNLKSHPEKMAHGPKDNALKIEVEGPNLKN